MKTALILSPHFPPSSLAGVHRARHLAKGLPVHGWRPVIVAADPGQYTEPSDHALEQLLPPGLAMERTRALPAGVCRLFAVGDIGLRAYPFFASAIETVIRRDNPAVVMITGSPFYPMLLANRIKAKFGLPVVLDFQDPWVSAFGQTCPRWSKTGLAHQLAERLEPIALRGSSFVTSVSDRQNAEMAGRYGWLDRNSMAAIPIGGDPADFIAMRANGSTRWPDDLPRDKLNFSYVGAALPRAEPLLRRVFRALGMLRSRQPRLAARVQFNFVGTSNNPMGLGGPRVMRFAQDEGVGDLVTEIPRRVPFIQSLAIMAQSHAVLMIGSDEPHYTASKIYSGLMSGRPFLSLYHRQSSSHTILSGAGGGLAFAFANTAELDGLVAPMADAIATLAEIPQSVGTVDPQLYLDYLPDAVAGRFAAIFDRLTSIG